MVCPENDTYSLCAMVTSVAGGLGALFEVIVTYLPQLVIVLGLVALLVGAVGTIFSSIGVAIRGAFNYKHK